jgi:hypothetical protein
MSSRGESVKYKYKYKYRYRYAGYMGLSVGKDLRGICDTGNTIQNISYGVHYAWVVQAHPFLSQTSSLISEIWHLKSTQTLFQNYVHRTSKMREEYLSLRAFLVKSKEKRRWKP